MGYQFSPRIRDVSSSRYWRISRKSDYGQLNDIAKNRINTALLADHWQDVLRLVGSLKVGAVKAPEIMRILARDGKTTGLGNAVAEVGRVAKTLYLLDYLDDEAYRRRILVQLNRGEQRGKVAREVCHGNKGELQQQYRAGMENQLGALGLVVNTIILWNTLYLQSAVKQLEAMGEELLDEDVARVSPLRWQHINMLGRYNFVLSPSVAGGDLRPLRDPNAETDLDFDLDW